MKFIVRVDRASGITLYVEGPRPQLKVDAEELTLTPFLKYALVFQSHDEAQRYLDAAIARSLMQEHALIEAVDSEDACDAIRYWIRIKDRDLFVSRHEYHRKDPVPMCDSPAYARLFLKEEDAEEYLDAIVEEAGFDRECAFIEPISYDKVELRLDTRKPDCDSLIVLKENGRWFLDVWCDRQGKACAEFTGDEAEHVIALITKFDEKLRRLQRITGES